MRLNVKMKETHVSMPFSFINLYKRHKLPYISILLYNNMLKIMIGK